jgi:hypothetical protein
MTSWMSSTELKRLIWPGVSAALAIGVGIYASVVLGHLTVSVLFLMLAAGALGWVVWVAFRAAQSLTTEPAALEIAVATGRRRKELEREKQALLKALKELEFDHEMSKVSDADYQEIGGNYRARAVRILRQLDAQSGDVDYRSLVERDLANRVKSQAGQEGPEVQKETSKKPERPVCVACSTTNDVDAEFCKKCGKRMNVEAAS